MQHIMLAENTIFGKMAAEGFASIVATVRRQRGFGWLGIILVDAFRTGPQEDRPLQNKSPKHDTAEILEHKDVLARLGSDWDKIRKRNNDIRDASTLHFAKTSQPGVELTEYEYREEDEHPLELAIELIAGWIGKNTYTLREFALRYTSAFGLDARNKRDGTRLEDLNYLLPIFRELDRDGYNSKLLTALFREHPDEMEKLGFDKSVIDRLVPTNGYIDCLPRRPLITEQKPKSSKPAAPINQTQTTNKAATESRKIDNSLSAVNKRARTMLEDYPEMRSKTVREWAGRLKCSSGLISKLPIWKAIQDAKPKPKSTTPRRTQTLSKGKKDSRLEKTVLDGLILSQEQDANSKHVEIPTENQRLYGDD